MFAYTKLMQAMVAAGAVSATDPYFNLVTLLLPGNGTNGAQNNTFLDSSSNNFTITRNGNTTQGTFSPFSQTGWGNYFNGSTDSIYTPSNAALGFGTGDFTVEFWIYPLSIASKSLYHGSATNSLVINTDASGKFIVRQYGVADLFTSSAALTTNAWNHIAVSRSGTTISAWLNGSRANGFTGTNSTNWATTAVYLGAADTAANYVNAYFSNVRVVKGTDVYGVSNSTITVPTAPLTAITNTQLLTCQSNRFIDNSSNAFAITVNGTPSVQAFSPFAPTAAYSAATNGGSGYFDGTGDYLTAASNAAFDVWGGNFTLEMWTYLTATPSNTVFFQWGSGTYLMQLEADTGGTFFGTYYYNAPTEINSIRSSTVPKINQWNHIALTKSGSTWALFLNGTRLGTSTSTSYVTGNLPVYIGANSTGAQAVQGYISSVRLVKGTAVYDPTQTSITVPTAPLTAITNTQLLLNFTNGGITDATAKNVLETVGNAQISTTQSKFGGSSMYFDGTGDWAQIPNNQLFNFGSGDFTIECWLYPTASGVGTIIAKRSGSNTAWLQLYYDSTNKIGVVVSFDGSTWGINSLGSTTVSLNTWTHVAFVRSGSSFKTYINGTADISATNSGSINFPSDAVTVGAGATSGIQLLTGYIDDLRITRFARYTGTFTPPTAAFPLS